MKKISYLILLIVIINSCEEKECCNYFQCDEIQETFKKDLAAKAIYSIEIDDRIYFWLNTDAVHFDGKESIIDSNCKEFCYFCGECAPPACGDLFPYDKTK
jgi:hypothetical protein